MSDPSPLRIIFAGTPDFSVPPLRALLAAGHHIVAVYTQPDRPSGRGRKLTPSPVKSMALEHSLLVEQPLNFKDPADVATLTAYQADLMVVVAYGLLLPVSVLQAPHLGCVNIHASLLPRWRGAAPIQRAILAGDKNAGISIMQMEKGLDTGPVYLMESIELADDETGGSLHDRLSTLGADVLLKALPGIANGRLPPVAQDDTQANYAHKLDKAEASIDWQQAAFVIERQVRAFNPWPVAQTRYKGVNMRIWSAHAIQGASSNIPGKVIAAGRDGIDVATGDGLLRITQLQIPGKRAMSAQDFMNANTIEGMVLGG